MRSATLLTRPSPNSTWSEPVQAFFGGLRPRKLRTMRRFAEEEIYLVDGPRAGMRFRVQFMPWTGLALDAMEDPKWRRIFARGSVQSGKTILFMVIPTLYHLFEVEENVIFGAPTAEMAWDVFKTRVLPIIKRSRYGDLLPRSGPGSRGGRATVLRFRNGVACRFMGAGGGDEQRSSFTARVVILTELDKMDVAGEVSRETNPVSQFEARTTAFGDMARIYGECTTTQETGRIYLETMIRGSGHRVHLQCPHCSEYVYPIRQNLCGWNEADNEIEAGKVSGYLCQRCEARWNEQDRQEALRHPLLVPKNMRARSDGTLEGDPPRTYTFGLVWNCMHSGMLTMSNVGIREWGAEKSGSPDDEKELCQFWWSQPYTEDIRAREVSFALLADHCHDHVPFDPLCATAGREDAEPRRLPEGAEWYVGAIDVQKRVLYYTVDGFNGDLTRWTVAWGVTEIVPEGAAWDPTKNHLRQALDATLHLLGQYDVVTTWVDCGYRHEGALEHVVRTWCAEQGDSVHALVGRSESQMHRLSGKTLDLPDGTPDLMQARLQDDGTVLWFFDVDRLKDEVYYRLFREFGSPGYHHFAREAANAKRTDRSKGAGALGYILSHYMRAKREITRRGVRVRRVWKERGRHDLWDCGCYALGGALVTLADMEADETEPPETPATTPPERSTIRTHY